MLREPAAWCNLADDMTQPLAACLTSTMFSGDDAAAVLAQDKHGDRTKLLEAVRAESQDRFLEALAAIFEAVDWSAHPDVLHPVLSLVGPASLDHLSIGDVLQFGEHVDGNDAGFALDVVRAIELDDAAAGGRVKDRLAAKTVPSTLLARPRVVFALPKDPVGGMRAAALLRSFLGDSDEEQLRAAVSAGLGGGNYATFVAGAIAASRELSLPEDVNDLQDSRRLAGRLMLWLAWSIDPSFGEEMLKSIVDSKYWDTGDVEAYRLPWDRSVEKVSAGKTVVTHLFGTTVLKATAAFDSSTGPPANKVAKWRISAKRHGDAKKAGKEMDKAAAAAGEPPSFQQVDLDRRLYEQARGTRERVGELLRQGADPNGGADLSDAYWQGFTTLHRATGSSDCAEIVRLLLAAGADPRAEWRGATTIDCFHGGDRLAVVAIDRLVAAGARSLKPDKLFEAAQHGYHAFAAALLRAGADPAAQKDGATALEVALQHKHLRTAIALGHEV